MLRRGGATWDTKDGIPRPLKFAAELRRGGSTSSNEKEPPASREFFRLSFDDNYSASVVSVTSVSVASVSAVSVASVVSVASGVSINFSALVAFIKAIL